MGKPTGPSMRIVRSGKAGTQRLLPVHKGFDSKMVQNIKL